MAEKKSEKEVVLCPLGRLLLDLERLAGARSEFFSHLNKSRIEFLKGLRSLLDDKIEHLEKKGASRPGKKMTNIKVE